MHTAEADAVVIESPPVVDRLALGAFLGAVAIGGSNFVAIRFSNRGLDPLWGAALRFWLAAAVFGLLCIALRIAIPRGQALVRIAVYGALGFGGAYGCMYWAMQDVPAGVAAIVLAVAPLLTLLLATAHGLEHLGVRPLAGALIAIAGSVVIFFQPDSLSFGLGSLAVIGVAALLASESVVVSKLAGRHHPVAMNFVGMTVGATALLIGAAIAGESFVLPSDGETQLALVYLVAATVGLFLLVLTVVQRWTASASSYIFVLMPVVAILMGSLLADEPITATTVLGGAIVSAGVYVGNSRRSHA